MTPICTTQELKSLCAKLSKSAFVTIDTEFMRERTYYAKLCLVQLAGETDAAVVDPLAEGIDLQPLFDLLADPSVLKVFHAGRQDIEIFVNLTGKVPAPVFDTQIAAMVCGFGESASYEKLASALADAKLDKSSRFTDWGHRPLTERQLDYALADVTHLRVVYAKLAEKLAKTGRTSWVSEEMDVLTSLSTYQIDPFEVWKRLKLRVDKPKCRAVLREIAAWREIEAQKANIPRARMIKDESLLEIAAHVPETLEDLARIRGLPSGFAGGKHGESLFDAIRRGAETPPKDCPPAEAKRRDSKSSEALFDLLKVLLHQAEDEHKVAARLIASTEDLQRLATEDAPDIKPLTGWRLEMFGKTALALKRGELALSVRKNKIVTTTL